MLNIKHILLYLLLLFTVKSYSQISSSAAYQFLNLSYTSRISALGGKLATLDESDISTVYANPALLDSSLNNHLAISYTKYFAGINYGAFSYGHFFNKVGTFAIGAQTVNYGSFIDADEVGTIQGSFTANDLAFQLSYSRAIDSTLTVGISAKTVFSYLERYKSYGIAFDIGGKYLSKSNLFSAGLVFRNIGHMVKAYTPNNMEPMPFEIVAGISQKLAHAPFRFIVTFHQLQNFDIYYDNSQQNQDEVLDDTSTKTGIAEKIGREVLSHTIIGAEFVPVKNFYLRFGYNYQRRNELKVNQKVSTVGFSWGIGIRISKFNINYSRATYHLAGPSNNFSIITNLNNFIKN